MNLVGTKICGSILVEPINKQCDIGVIFMESGSYLNMCEYGTIRTVTLCINTGLIEKKDKVIVDTLSLLWNALFIITEMKLKQLNLKMYQPLCYIRN